MEIFKITAYDFDISLYKSSSYLSNDNEEDYPVTTLGEF